MLKPDNGSRLENLWDENQATGMTEPELLLYRSNLLGSDKRVTNYGGGNTSAKVMQTDPLTGAMVEVLWVKGSGGDVGTIKMDGFATLYMDKLNALKSIYRGVEFEDEMVGYLPHCTFNLNSRAASIDTPLHAYVTQKHVDHMHPDAIIAIAAADNSEELTQKIFGDKIGWLPWKRPGYELGLWLEKFCRDNPDAKGVVLESHGLFTWADTARECYDLTIDIINRAIGWFERETAGKPVFGGEKHPALPAGRRREIAAALMPAIRGMVSKDVPMVGHFEDADAVLQFVCARDMPALAALGTSCPDHFLRTKIRPLLVDFDPAHPDVDTALEKLAGAVADYRAEYAAYYERCKHDDSPAMRDANAVVYLIPGVGMITFAKDKATARISGEFYTNAINVMRGASTVSRYCGLPEQEAFDIEYWLLEEAKLQRMPKPKSLAGRIAIVTGGAGGIGSATAERLLSEGACVVLADIDEAALAKTQKNLAARYSFDVVRTVSMNVTSEDAVIASYTQMAVEYGGVDIIVSNAGIASSAAVEDTTLELWNRNMSILSTGYFLVAREAFKMLKKQDIGGSIIFIGSKNGLAASPGASAYCTAKASELEEHYRQRSLLKRSVLPEDIAEAAYFFASDVSAKSTGNIINVDAGNVQAFTR